MANIIKVTQLISSTELKKLRSLNPLRVILRIIFECLLVLSIISLSWLYLPIIFWPLSMLLIASRQHCLLTLLHEAAHGVLFKSRLANNIIGEYIGFMHYITMHGYRRHHKKHHKHKTLNTLDDPDWARKQNKNWVFPMKRSHLIKLLMKDILMLNTGELVQELFDAKNNNIEGRSDYIVLASRIVFYSLLILILTHFNLWKPYILFWTLPILTFLKAILRIRSIADHFMLKNQNLINKSRTILAPWWERLLIAPCSIGVHTPHHLFQNIPYYNLISSHKTLMKNNTYQKYCIVEKSYLSTLKKMTQRA